MICQIKNLNNCIDEKSQIELLKLLDIKKSKITYRRKTRDNNEECNI